MIWIVIGVTIVVLGLVLLIRSRRGTPDGVASFQRQIDALSPEARRPVVDRVQRLNDPPPPISPLEEFPPTSPKQASPPRPKGNGTTADGAGGDVAGDADMPSSPLDDVPGEVGGTSGGVVRRPDGDVDGA